MPSTAELTAISLSVRLLLAEAAPLPLRGAFVVEFGTRTSDVALYDSDCRRIHTVGSSAPSSTQAATIESCRRKSHSTRRTSILCSDN